MTSTRRLLLRAGAAAVCLVAFFVVMQPQYEIAVRDRCEAWASSQGYALTDVNVAARTRDFGNPTRLVQSDRGPESSCVATTGVGQEQILVADTPKNPGWNVRANGPLVVSLLGLAAVIWLPSWIHGIGYLFGSGSRGTGDGDSEGLEG